MKTKLRIPRESRPFCANGCAGPTHNLFNHIPSGRVQARALLMRIFRRLTAGYGADNAFAAARIASIHNDIYIGYYGRNIALAFMLALSLALSACSPTMTRLRVNEPQIETAILGTTWTLDTISTHTANVDHPQGFEQGIFFHRSRSTPKIMGAWALADVGTILLANQWKRHVTNRYLHPFWRVWLIVPSEEHTRAAIGNFSRLN